jgi:hypothetical protein
MQLNLIPNFANVGLPIRPVLDCGFIVFAHAHYANVRTVSFENPEAYYRDGNNDFGDSKIQKSYIGTGKNIDAALNQALHLFHQADSNCKSLYTVKERTHEIKSIIAKLDNWLISHKGKLRAVSDFDGTVLVKLEGLTDPTDNLSPRLTIEGFGRTLYDALFCAFERPATTNIQHMPAKNIEIKTDADGYKIAKPIVHPRTTIKIYPAKQHDSLATTDWRVRIS